MNVRNVRQKKQQSVYISQEKLLALVDTLLSGSSGREDDDHPLPPGPWDPVVRVALERMDIFRPPSAPWGLFLASVLARHPEIWDAIDPHYRVGGEVALNPQPLPPRFAFLTAVTQVVTGRAELLYEVADAVSQEGEHRSTAGYIARFVDDWCGNSRPKWPFPWPPPPWWFDRELNSVDLFVMAAQFDRAAKEAFNPGLRQNFMDATTKFVEAGLSKM